MHRLLATLLGAALLGAVAVPAIGAALHLGRPITAQQAATAGTTIFADGRGLPPGSGNARAGQIVFEQQCIRCHGAGARGGSAPELVGGTGPLSAARPDKTISLYWPSAATLFDFNRHAMPMDRPGSLSNDEAYAVTAFLLHAEGLIGADEAMTARTLARVQMPNRGGFRVNAGTTQR
jgi:mono/diheme cytochrome c family protein